jgi:cephalosporin-C deacetylase
MQSSAADLSNESTAISAEKIDAFWLEAARELAEEPIYATCEPDNENVPYQVFKVSFRTLGGRQISARLAKPFDQGNPRRQYPVIISSPGYSGVAFAESLSDCQRGYIILQVFPRMQGLSGSADERDPVLGTNWLLYGLQNAESYFYRGAFCDLRRAVDYLLTRPDVDPDRIGAMGSSQGGFLVLGLAAIDSRVKAVAAHVPFLCDLRHNRCFDPAGGTKTYWDGWQARPDPRLFDVFDYFDPVHLAHRILVPTMLSAGGADDICPAETVHAVFDRLPGIKSLTHFPSLAHTSSTEFVAASWEWMRTYLKERQS